ncbi:MAG: PQQ-binding-like beta-propeller repeat protein [Acidobacteriia bacterium]|nr:PQQ-binding-like beta-propeller repeat protein [Terriglobia bacterium]
MCFSSFRIRRPAASVAVLLAASLFTACGGSSSTPPPPVAPSITSQPSNQTVVVGQPATFAVVAAGTSPLSYQWQKGGVSIPGATSASYTTPATTLGDNGSQFGVTISNSLGNVTSNTATLNVAVALADVVTFQYNNARTGANLGEVILTPSNVNSTKFGKIGSFTVDGKVDAQPLYLSQHSIAGGTHNVLYVATEHDSVYAFDADSGAVLWQKSMLGTGETTSEPVNGCSQVTPEIGITSTPVIDRSRGAIYLVAMSKSGSSYFQRIHALSLSTGNELFGGPVAVQALYPGTGDGASGGNVTFSSKQYEERAALLLLNGVLYTTWTSHCDIRPYTGWVIGYDASTLSQTHVLNVTPNGNEGAIWMAGNGPAADAGNNIYFLTGNGTFDTTLDANGFPSQDNYGNAFVKLSTSGTLSVADYFTMSNTIAESNADIDLGSGGAIVLPDLSDNGGQIHQLAVGAGKDSIIYVVDRNAMGKFHSTDTIYQEILGALAGSVFSTPAYFNQTIYYGAVSDAIKAFTISNARLGTSPSSRTSITFTYPGATPSVSANGTGSAILWAVENSNPAVLHAYDATNLATELYNSNQAAGSRDQFGPGNKFIAPIIANGKVYVGTPTGVAVFGLLP